MDNLSQIKREEMLKFLEGLGATHTDDASIRALSEIENYICEKKFGLVWEEHTESVDDQIKENIPVFIECEDQKVVNADDNTFNFILEGDNLQSLYLLQKTHRNKINVIYIDPPYNTKNKDFIFDDKRIDENDGFKHSKWLSFMSKRLKIARSLLAEDGVIAISIGYQEIHHLMLLCQEIFRSKNIVCVTVQTSSGNAVQNGFKYVQEYIVFITPTPFFPREIESDKTSYENPYHGMTLSGYDQVRRPNQCYPIFIDADGKVAGCGKSLQQRINEEIYTGDKADFVFDYEEAPEGCVAVWPVTKNGDPCVWRLAPESFINNWVSGYIKVVPNTSGANRYTIQYLSEGIIEQIREGTLETVQLDENVPTLDVLGYKTEASGIRTVWDDTKFLTSAGSRDIKKVFGRKIDFSFPKPVDLIKEILMRVSKDGDVVLDFFAGSGTTAQAVLELNSDTETRSFILCTNNELTEEKQVGYFVERGYIEKRPRKGTKKEEEWKEQWEEFKSSEEYTKETANEEYLSMGICHSVTYPRVKTVITGERSDGSGYSNGISANLKYFKCGWTPRKPEDYLLSNCLCLHVKEMIELQNGMEIDNVHNILVLNKSDFKTYVKNNTETIENIWVNQNIVLNAEEMERLETLGFKYIPREFFGQELREVAE